MPSADRLLARGAARFAWNGDASRLEARAFDPRTGRLLARASLYVSRSVVDVLELAKTDAGWRSPWSAGLGRALLRAALLRARARFGLAAGVPVHTEACPLLSFYGGPPPRIPAAAERDPYNYLALVAPDALQGLEADGAFDDDGEPVDEDRVFREIERSLLTPSLVRYYRRTFGLRVDPARPGDGSCRPMVGTLGRALAASRPGRERRP